MSNNFQDLNSLDEIQSTIEQLQERAKQIKTAEKSTIIADINQKIANYGLTVADLKFKKEKAEPQKATVKYKDKAGSTWTGRGLKPKWLSSALNAGAKLEDFAV